MFFAGGFGHFGNVKRAALCRQASAAAPPWRFRNHWQILRNPGRTIEIFGKLTARLAVSATMMSVCVRPPHPPRDALSPCPHRFTPPPV
jgi:hypothetical protein